jgi:hypothetical protein
LLLGRITLANGTLVHKRGKIGVSEPFFYYKYHMDWPGIE